MFSKNILVGLRRMRADAINFSFRYFIFSICLFIFISFYLCILRGYFFVINIFSCYYLSYSMQALGVYASYSNSYIFDVPGAETSGRQYQTSLRASPVTLM